MMIDLILSFVLGIIAGVISGLIPGIHPNLYASLVFLYLKDIKPLDLSIFLISSVVTNSFVSFIPSIYLGAPETSTSLSVLPGHRYLLKGKGHFAVKLTVIGGLTGSILLLMFIPIIAIVSKFISRKVTVFVLVLLSVWMLISEKNKIWGFLIFLASGILGLVFLSKGFFFAIFSGLFGLPLLFISWIKGVNIGEKIDFSDKDISKKGVFVGFLSGLFSTLFPAIGPAQASLISQEIVGEKDDNSFLISMGSITTIDAILSIILLYYLGKGRNGISVFINKILGSFGFDILVLFVLISIASVFIASFITLKISRIFALNIRKINYSRLSKNVFFFILFLSFLIEGIPGILITLTSFFLGLIANLKGVRRVNLMGVLVIPTLLILI